MMLAFGWPVSFDRPEWLWLMLTIPVIVAISLRSLAGLDPTRRIVAVTLRSLVIVVLSFVLARIEYVKRNDNVAVMFVMDKSHSIPEDLRLKTEQYIKEVARKARGDDRVGVVSFDGEADVDVIPSRVGLDVPGFSIANYPDRTNLAAGLRMALATFPEGFARRVVIISDGNENVGEVADEIETAIANQVAVDVIPLEYEHEDEILFDRIVVPAQASRDTKVPVRLLIKSRKPTRVNLTFYHNGVEVPLADPVLTLSGDMRPDPFTIPIELRTGGVHRFDARLIPQSGMADSVPENNRATAFTFVDDKGKVLILANTGSTDEQLLYEAMLREKVDVEMRTIDQVAIDLLKLQEYDVVIVSNISADSFNDDQHKALSSYVRDFGGGLIMTGGNEGFGAGGWIGTPIEEVSPVWFEVKHKKIIPRGALAIIMHSCEIPRGNYWGEQVAIAAIKAISSLDYLGVICYSYKFGGPNWDVPLAPAVNKPAIIRTVKNMQIGDMPDFDKTMKIAVRDLMRLRGVSQRHMVIISDGDPSPPSDQVIQTMIDNNITCSAVGIGYGSHVMEAPLRRIARKTKGRFYGVKNPRRLPQIFVKEAKVIKRSLIDDRNFMPQLFVPFAQTVLGLREGDIPPLGGLVLTTPKADCVMPLTRKTSDGDDPVLAHWNYEMGKMAVFTSGMWKRWGANWAEWEKFGKFWAQVVRWAMRQPGSADFDVMTRLEGKKGRVVIEALNKDASYLNFLRIQGRMATPSGEVKPLYLTQTGPGQYETTFDVDDNGNYLINLQYSDPDHGKGMIRTGLSVPYSQEFRELQANVPLLQQVIDRTGGRKLKMDPETDNVFDRENLPISVSRQPIWRWVVQWILLPLFLLDVAGRRLASAVAMSIYVEASVLIFTCALLYTVKASPWSYVLALILAEAVGWTIRRRSIMPTIQFFTSTVTALSHAGTRSAQSLSQLKGVRSKVRDDLETGRAEKIEKTTISLEPAADPRARFDVGDEQAAQPAADVTKTLGEAAATKIEMEQRKAAQKRSATGESDLAARLRKAKRRAQDEIQERKKDE